VNVLPFFGAGYLHQFCIPRKFVESNCFTEMTLLFDVEVEAGSSAICARVVCGYFSDGVVVRLAILV
jgi:hypothetical protein